VNLRLVLTLVSTLALLALCGCGTVTSRAKGLGGRYSGFGYDMEKLSSAEGWFGSSAEGHASNVPVVIPGGVFWLLDIPFSLIADTILLPVDALRRAPPKPEGDSAIKSCGI
jgi:uncharacterized protein YceK